MAACERCPFAGGCGSRPLCRPQSIEFGKKRLTVNTLREVPKEFKGVIDFNSVRQGISELPTPINKFASNEVNKFASNEVNKFASNEVRTSKETKMCSRCQKPASACGHSESETFAKAA